MTRALLGEPIAKCSRCNGERIIVGKNGQRACPTCKGEGIVVAWWWDPSSPNPRPLPDPGDESPPKR